MEGRDEVFRAGVLGMVAGNRLFRKEGCSPSQWLTREDVTIPGDLSCLGEEDNLSALDELERNPKGSFGRLAEIRTGITLNHVKATASKTVRAAVLLGAKKATRFQPRRGSVAFYWRIMPKRFGIARRWHGPVRVIGEDHHGWWVIHRGWPILVNREQLRSASRREIRAWKFVSQEKELVEEGEQQGFEDYRGPGPSEVDFPGPEDDLDEDGDAEEDAPPAAPPGFSPGGGGSSSSSSEVPMEDEPPTAAPAPATPPHAPSSPRKAVPISPPGLEATVKYLDRRASG